MKSERYKLLIQDFLNRVIDVKEFERAYLQEFKKDRFGDGAEYDILNDLFLDIDAFQEDPAIRRSDGLDEAQLRKKAEDALCSLDNLHGEA